MQNFTSSAQTEEESIERTPRGLLPAIKFAMELLPIIPHRLATDAGMLKV